MRPSERELRRRTRHRGRVFDVQPSRDDESLNYPVRPELPTAIEPVRKAWRRGPVLDQGQEGACVGHGVVGELAATPYRVDFTAPGTMNADVEPPPADGIPRTAQEAAFWFYHRAQKLDEWPGEDYSGTSVNAGMKVARNQGLITGWRWATTRLDLRDTLITLGPVVIAIPWYDGMYSCPTGLLKVTGNYVGWHCLMVNAYDPRFSVAGEPASEKHRLLNSWGTGWGLYGSAWMEAGELWRHINDNGGEIAVPLGRSLAAA